MRFENFSGLTLFLYILLHFLFLGGEGVGGNHLRAQFPATAPFFCGVWVKRQTELEADVKFSSSFFPFP